MEQAATHTVAETTRSRWQRVAPVACGCALAGAATLVTLFDPAASGSRFPACQFKAMTGLWCPGCGLTRGFHQLFTGHPLTALQYNLFVPLVLLAVVAGWWSWLRVSRDKQRLSLPSWALRPIAVYLPIALVTYGVLRNIPTAPFTSLAP